MGLVRGGILFGFPAGVVIGGVVSELAGTVTAFVVAAAFAALPLLAGVALLGGVRHETGQFVPRVKS